MNKICSYETLFSKKLTLNILIKVHLYKSRLNVSWYRSYVILIPYQFLCTVIYLCLLRVGLQMKIRYVIFKIHFINAEIVQNDAHAVEYIAVGTL